MRTPSGAADEPPEMMFIVRSNIDGIDPATRKQIRSHARQGKKGKRETKKMATFRPKEKRATVKLRDVVDSYMSLQPGRVGTRMYFVDFPSEIEPSMLIKMAQVSTVAMRIIFPLLMGIGFHPEGKAWLYPTGRDIVALHINAFAIQSFIDRILNQQPAHMVNSVAILHHQKGLMLLQRRLVAEDDEAKLSDDTISAILKLATAAMFDGDADVAKKHMQGLRKMVDLRGGLGVFGANPKLLVELWRCDLGIALLATSEPTFYAHLAEQVPDYPDQVASSFGPKRCCIRDPTFLHNLHTNLVEAWRVTKKFCLLANLGTQTQTLVEPAMIYGTMTAVMYRLVHMSFAAGSLDETVRLGLLAFTHHIFLQWKDVHIPRHGFEYHYRQYLTLHQDSNTISPRLMLWLLMIGEVSKFWGLDEPWPTKCFRREIERCNVKSLKDLQEVLKAHMWISLLDDEAAQLAWHRYSQGSVDIVSNS